MLGKYTYFSVLLIGSKWAGIISLSSASNFQLLTLHFIVCSSVFSIVDSSPKSESLFKFN